MQSVKVLSTHKTAESGFIDSKCPVNIINNIYHVYVMRMQ